MSKKACSIVVLFALGACGAPAIDRSEVSSEALSPAQLPAPPMVGSKFVFCVGKNDSETCVRDTIEVLSVADDGCITEAGSEGEYTICPSIGPGFHAVRWSGPAFGTGSRSYTDKEGSVWPLTVGGRYSFSEKGESDRHGQWTNNGSMRVIGVERLTVPAGTFDTYRIEISSGQNRYVQLNYAPEIERVVFWHRRHRRDGDDPARYLAEIIEP